jgi:hypothetical protein
MLLSCFVDDDGVARKGVEWGGRGCDGELGRTTVREYKYDENKRMLTLENVIDL